MFSANVSIILTQTESQKIGQNWRKQWWMINKQIESLLWLISNVRQRSRIILRLSINLFISFETRLLNSLSWYISTVSKVVLIDVMILLAAKNLFSFLYLHCGLFHWRLIDYHFGLNQFCYLETSNSTSTMRNVSTMGN